MFSRSSLAALTLLGASLASGQSSYPYVIRTVVGVNPLGDGGLATSALLEFPRGVAVAPNGSMYIGDRGNNLIRVVNSAGKINTILTGSVACMKADSAGNIYSSDGGFRIYKILPTGDFKQIAGAGVGYFGDGGPALAAKFSSTQGIAVDANNNIYVADMLNNRIRKITPDGNIQTVAGNGNAGFGADNINALNSPLAFPNAVEVDSSGNLYIAELFRIRKVNISVGTITTIAGNGNNPTDGQALTTAVGTIVSLAMDSTGNLYFTDWDFNRLRMISPGGTVTTLAGNGASSFSGDGSFAFRATLFHPSAVAIDAQNNVYVTDEYNSRVRKITANGNINTVAGATHFAGDGGDATASLIHRAEHAIADPAGNLYIADTYNHRIRKVTNGIISTIAGTGDCSYSGDHGKATLATICEPEGLAFDSGGNLYIADWYNGVVRKIDSSGIITTVAGNGGYADTGDNGQAVLAQMKGPYGLTFDTAGNLYISDDLANRVRKVSTAGIITAFAGSGASGGNGDGGLATSAQLSGPGHMAFGSDGSLYISDTGNSRIRKVTTGGSISTVAGLQTCCASGVPAASMPLLQPDGIGFDSAGNMYVAWGTSGVVTKTTLQGVTSIVAGNGSADFSGDGGIASAASFDSPSGLAVDPSGDFYVADYFNNRIRKVILNSPASLSISSGDNQSGPAGAALPNPVVVAVAFRAGTNMSGLSVSFAVTSGAATLSAATGTTDNLGRAGVSVTFGSTPGPVVITATLTGLPPVQFHLTASPAVPLPTIDAGGIVGAGGSIPAVRVISAGGFATIFGSNFAPAGTFAQPSSASWPTQLAGVCVQVNGVSAYVTFVSPTQINIQVPAIPSGSSVAVQVITGCGGATPLQSVSQNVNTADASPEFLYWVKNADGRNPVIAVNAVTGAYVAAAGLIPGLTFTPAKSGDVLTIYGVSFGPTTPLATPGLPPTAIAKSTYNPVVILGTSVLDSANVLYAGVSPGTAGLYQLNIIVPPNLPDGDYKLTLTLGPFSTPLGGYITVKQ